MNNEEVIKQMNSYRPAFLDLFGCNITEIDIERGICKMDFTVSKDYCHSENIIQGGFITTMLDAVSSHAVFALQKNVTSVSTLELKVSYYAPSHNGEYKAIGKVEKLTRNFAFLSADLYNSDGERTASLTSTSKVSYLKK